MNTSGWPTLTDAMTEHTVMQAKRIFDRFDADYGAIPWLELVLLTGRTEPSFPLDSASIRGWLGKCLAAYHDISNQFDITIQLPLWAAGPDGSTLEGWRTVTRQVFARQLKPSCERADNSLKEFIAGGREVKPPEDEYDEVMGVLSSVADTWDPVLNVVRNAMSAGEDWREGLSSNRHLRKMVSSLFKLRRTAKHEDSRVSVKRPRDGGRKKAVEAHVDKYDLGRLCERLKRKRLTPINVKQIQYGAIERTVKLYLKEQNERAGSTGLEALDPWSPGALAGAMEELEDRLRPLQRACERQRQEKERERRKKDSCSSEDLIGELIHGKQEKTFKQEQMTVHHKTARSLWVQKVLLQCWSYLKEDGQLDDTTVRTLALVAELTEDAPPSDMAERLTDMIISKLPRTRQHQRPSSYSLDAWTHPVFTAMKELLEECEAER